MTARAPTMINRGSSPLRAGPGKAAGVGWEETAVEASAAGEAVSVNDARVAGTGVRVAGLVVGLVCVVPVPGVPDARVPEAAVAAGVPVVGTPGVRVLSGRRMRMRSPGNMTD